MSAREHRSTQPKPTPNSDYQKAMKTMGFLNASGPGAPSAKFPSIGTKVGGEVVEILPERQAREYKRNATDPDIPKTFSNGDPVMEYPVIVQLAGGFTKIRETDTGRRGFYAQKSSGLFKAIVEACRRAGKEVEVGDYLEVELVDKVQGKGSMPKNVFAAVLHPAGTWENRSTGFLATDDNEDDERELVGAVAAPTPAALPRSRRPATRTAATPPSAGGSI